MGGWVLSAEIRSGLDAAAQLGSIEPSKFLIQDLPYYIAALRVRRMVQSPDAAAPTTPSETAQSEPIRPGWKPRI